MSGLPIYSEEDACKLQIFDLGQQIKRLHKKRHSAHSIYRIHALNQRIRRLESKLLYWEMAK